MQQPQNTETEKVSIINLYLKLLKIIYFKSSSFHLKKQAYKLL